MARVKLFTIIVIGLLVYAATLNLSLPVLLHAQTGKPKEIVKTEPVKSPIQLADAEQKGIIDYQNQINLLQVQIENLQLKQQIAIHNAAEAHGIKLSEYDFGQVAQGLGFTPKPVASVAPSPVILKGDKPAATP